MISSFPEKRGRILKKKGSMCLGMEQRNTVLRNFMHVFREPKGLGEYSVGYKELEWWKMRLNCLTIKTYNK